MKILILREFACTAQTEILSSCCIMSFDYELNSPYALFVSFMSLYSLNFVTYSTSV